MFRNCINDIRKSILNALKPILNDILIRSDIQLEYLRFTKLK